MEPRIPTLNELEDIFSPSDNHRLNTQGVKVMDYTYAIGILRTEYEKLEDRLEIADKYTKEYGLSADKERVTEIINKLNELNKAIEVLKGDE